MTRNLPEYPSLEHLKKQAKELLSAYAQGAPEAIERFGAFATGATSATAKLADAQHVIAREYGYTNWAQLKQYVETAPRQDPAEELEAAVRASDASRVARVLKRNQQLKSRINDPLPNYGFGGTALFAAVQRSDQKTVEVLLDAGADINGRTHWWAGGFGVLDDCSPEFASFLIERGAFVDAHAAARLGMFERLKELITADPELVHARGGDGQTPLHFASTIEIAEYLVEHGAEIDARDIDHESTPAQYMTRVTQKRHYPRDRQEIARFLVARGCRTDILMAAALGDIELVRKHLDADPESIRTDVSARYFRKQNPRSGGPIYIWTFGPHRTAHQVARDFGHEEIFQLLMERSPEDLKLAQACELGEEETFNALLASHPGLAANLSETDRRKLADAAQNNNTAAVRLMLRAGWPVEVRGEHGGTPLHWASWHGNAEMVREILRYAPPIEIRGDDHNLTPLGWALHGSENSWHRATGDHAATVEALLDAGVQAPPVTEDLEASEAVREVLRRHEQSQTA